MSKWNVKVAGNAQFNEGDGVQNNGPASAPTVASFFDSLSKALPQDDSEQSQLAHEALNALEVAASNDTPPSESWYAPYIEKLAPYAPMLSNVLLAFGDGFFSTLASRNPIVAGVVEAFKAARQ